MFIAWGIRIHIWGVYLCGFLPRNGIQEILYPEAPGAFFQDSVKEFTPMSSTFTSLTGWIGSDSDTAAKHNITWPQEMLIQVLYHKAVTIIIFFKSQCIKDPEIIKYVIKISEKIADVTLLTPPYYFTL